MNSAPRTSVIVPVKDDELVFACIEGVEAAAPDEIIVVDNGSEAAFARELTNRLSDRVILLRVDEPGVYRARNAAVDAATGGVIFFTDADCRVEPAWIEAGLRAIERGADIVQGYSGAAAGGRVSGWLQSRYEAHLRKLRAGDGTETDTRNMAVRREVFGALRFNERFRRVGDTEFGLLAEVAGFRVAYEPAMRVAHAHDEDLRVFAAKQVCHGWGAQRVMQEHPEVEWHGGHLKLVARVSDRLSRMRWLRPLARLLAWKAITGAALLQRAPQWLPGWAAVLILTVLDKTAALSGHLSYRPGEPEPSPSGLLGRRLPRD